MAKKKAKLENPNLPSPDLAGVLADLYDEPVTDALGNVQQPEDEGTNTEFTFKIVGNGLTRLDALLDAIPQMIEGLQKFKAQLDQAADEPCASDIDAEVPYLIDEVIL